MVFVKLVGLFFRLRRLDGMRKKRDEFVGDDEFEIKSSGCGTRALLGAVLGQAVRDLVRSETRQCWPEMKMNAAKWILGIGSENGGGVSIEDVASELGVSSQGIAEALGAEERLEGLIRQKAERRAAHSRRRKGGGLGEMLVEECYYA